MSSSPVVTPLVLVAHGSRDRRAAAATRALVRTVAFAQPGLDVRAAYLDHTAPSLGAALTALSMGGHGSAVVVPLLLTEAYHGRVDIPAVLNEVRAAGVPLRVDRAAVIGPARGSVDPELIGALRRRLCEARLRYDGLVLAAAGTRDAVARTTVDDAAQALSEALGGVQCLPGYASGSVQSVGGVQSACDVQSVGGAVASLRSAGARRVAVASYFLAPGFLHDRALAGARAAGAMGASEPLGAAPELARLVLTRARAALQTPAAAPAAASVDHGVCSTCVGVSCC
jgi:sirohydrochlorin ferrochelatase